VSESAATHATIVIGTTMAPSAAYLRQEICTPSPVRRSCQSSVASDAHGVMSGPALTPISRAAMRAGVPATGSSARYAGFSRSPAETGMTNGYDAIFFHFRDSSQLNESFSNFVRLGGSLFLDR